MGNGILVKENVCSCTMWQTVFIGYLFCLHEADRNNYKITDRMYTYFPEIKWAHNISMFLVDTGDQHLN